VKKRKRGKKRGKGRFASFYRVIRSAGAATVTRLDRLFFECTSAHIFTFSTPLRVTSVPSLNIPSFATLFDPSYRLPARSFTLSIASCKSERRDPRNEGQRVHDRYCRRETGGTRPAAIPRYTNLLAKLAKLVRGFWNSKMARISA